MKKLMVILVMYLTMCNLVIAAENTSIVNYDGIKYHVNSILKDGTTYVAARTLSNVVGIEVEYLPEYPAAEFKTSKTKMLIDLKDGTTYINDIKQSKNASFVLDQGTTYLPLRYILESFEYRVGWNNNMITVEPPKSKDRDAELLKREYAKAIHCTRVAITTCSWAEENGHVDTDKDLRDIQSLLRLAEKSFENLMGTEYEVKIQGMRSSINQAKEFITSKGKSLNDVDKQIFLDTSQSYMDEYSSLEIDEIITQKIYSEVLGVLE